MGLLTGDTGIQLGKQFSIMLLLLLGLQTLLLLLHIGVNLLRVHGTDQLLLRTVHASMVASLDLLLRLRSVEVDPISKPNDALNGKDIPPITDTYRPPGGFPLERIDSTIAQVVKLT